MTAINKQYIQVKNGEYTARIENGVITNHCAINPENTCDVWGLPYSIDELKLLIKHCQEVISLLEKPDYTDNEG